MPLGDGLKTTLRKLFKDFHLEKIKLNLKIAEVEFSFQKTDRDAAWELYVEMLTRIVTQPLPTEAGDEQTALDSVYSLFPTTREILRRHGAGAVHFSKVAIPVLNQVVRPFTAKWHKESLAGAFRNETKRKEFRAELEAIQEELRNYNRILAEIAGVEDLTDMELAGDAESKQVALLSNPTLDEILESPALDDGTKDWLRDAKCLGVFQNNTTLDEILEHIDVAASDDVRHDLEKFRDSLTYPAIEIPPTNPYLD